ncbi:MAG: AI-2E family transporter [Cyanobacteria bacterium P01_H01_bin.15]
MFDTIIRFVVLALLATWCFLLLRPFLALILWGSVIAVALYPVFLWLSQRLGNRRNLAATLLVLLGVGVILGPVSFLITASVDSIQTFALSVDSGNFEVPPPPNGIESIPVFGGSVDDIWQEASDNLVATLQKYQPQLQDLATKLLAIAGTASLGILQFLVAVIIAGGLMLNAGSIGKNIQQLTVRLSPEQGADFVVLATATIRNVTRGVIGIAVIQTLIVGIGFVLGGFPLSAFLTGGCLILTIIQVGPGLIVIPSIIYAWTSMGTFQAILFTIWMLFGVTIDNILKPLLMARGLSVPMLVIFIGVIGGTLAHGIIGLFVGPVILSLGYELMTTWVGKPVAIPPETQTAT